MVRLNGNDVEVTEISPPSDTKSMSFFSKFGRVSSSNWGGAWKYNRVFPEMTGVDVESDGFFIWLVDMLTPMFWK